MPPRTLVIGSSLTKELNRYCTEIGEDNGGVNYALAWTKIHGIGGIMVTSVGRCFDSSLGSFHPHNVILQMGGNDAANPNINVDDIVSAIIRYSYRLVEEFRVKKVYVVQILPRYSTNEEKTLYKTGIAEELFRNRMKQINAKLHKKLLSEPYIDFRTFPSLNLAPSSMFRDGTHFNDRGLQRFYRETRGVILRSIHA